MFQFVQMTATYSNAVLVTILPHFTDVAQKLNLHVHTPITPAQVRSFYCDPRANEVGGSVVLTNGYRFCFLDGDVSMFETTFCYFTLQNPDWIPYFHGTLRMNVQEAVAMARDAVHKLGHHEKIFDDEPKVILAPKDLGKYVVPQYRIEWLKPGVTNPIFNVAAEVVVNGDLKRIERFAFMDKQFWKPNPEIAVKPKLLPPPPPLYVGGRRMTPVSATYSNAFINATLPQFTDFARRLGLPLSLPIERNQITNVELGLLDDDPQLQIILTNGDRFNYDKGHISGYYANNSYYASGSFGRPLLNKTDLYWPHPVSREDMIQLARDAVHRLGYPEKVLQIDGKPDFVTIPEDTKTNFFTRYEIGWHRIKISGMDGFKIYVEVDAKTRTVKTLQLNKDTNFWREPPKIDVPPESTE